MVAPPTPGNNGAGGGSGRKAVIIPELFPWRVTAQLGMLFHRYRDWEAMPSPVNIECLADAWFYLSLFQDPSRVVVTCYSPEATLLDHVGGLLSKMDDGSFLLSCSSNGGNNREVGDGGEDGGGVEQGLIIAGGRDPLWQGVRHIAVLVVDLVNDGDRCLQDQRLSPPRRCVVTPFPDTWHTTMTTATMRTTTTAQRCQRHCP
jgi:hypothetical protein